MKFFLNIILFLFFSYLGYILIPSQVFQSGFWWLAIPFILLFSLVTLCTIKNLKINLKNSRGSKRGLFASALGFGALQVCGLSAYACSTALGFTILATILPHSILNIFQQYSVFIIIFSIFVQIYALIQLNCLSFIKKS